MSVFDAERRSATRSALRYRPVETGDAGQAGPEPLVARQRRSRPITRMISAHAQPDDPSSQAEPHPSLKQRSAPPVRRVQRFHPLFFVGTGLLLALLLWIGLTQLVVWGTNQYNTLVYGYPRTFQLDAVVGHSDSAQRPSHFIAVNLHGNVNILEFPGGDPSHARVFVFSSSLGPGADQAVVTLRFFDVDHQGKPDMLISIDGIQGFLLNDGKTFRMPTSTEQQQILQILRHTQS